MKDIKLDTYIKQCRDRVDLTLKALLPPAHQAPQHLYQAMQYCVLNGGKRLRSCLIYAVGEAFGGDKHILDHVSAAMEMIHAFSLIHDDLPALDNDDMRRGKPSCHKAFGEGIAILAGDALALLPFEIISNLDQTKVSVKNQLKMVNILAKLIGPSGGIAGETFDIESFNKSCSLNTLRYHYALKTGNVISASILLGALASNCDDSTVLKKLKVYGNHIGIAFQLHDDVLTLKYTEDQLGKSSASDIKKNKPTFASIIGVNETQTLENKIIEKAISHIRQLDINAEKLIEISNYIITRKQ